MLLTEYLIASLLQTSIQLKHVTHLLWYICLFFESMQDALHFIAHNPHILHLSSTNLIFSREYLLRNPSVVPTGQMVLQYILPPRHDIYPIAITVIKAITVDETLSR